VEGEFNLKIQRDRSAEPYFSNGQLLFLISWNQDYPLLIEQLIHYPLAAHDDEPDALAGAVQIITQGQSKSEVLVPREGVVVNINCEIICPW
jgi:phage terminase large subunit-like protein